MKKLKFYFFIFLGILLYNRCGWDQSTQLGPYTVYVISDGVYHIEDANDKNPAGVHYDANGKEVGFNGCSDIYLVVGEKKALLIDLSTTIDWDTSATSSLRSIVYERVGSREFYITITHNHYDHLGMLPAFVNDPKANFWIPKAEFAGVDIFPKDRTTYFAENESFDLGGGFVINSLEVPGHTEHSNVYFLKDKNLVFTGDAIGSGDEIWLFSYEGFIDYVKAIDKLIKYIQDPANHIDPEKLNIYSGHYYQKNKPEELSTELIYDMKTLIGEIGAGTARTKPVSHTTFINTDFSYGTATIAWNKDAAERYVQFFHTK